MPFKSDKQRRFLWSQKPEVAKKFAEHHQRGGHAGRQKNWGTRREHMTDDIKQAAGVAADFLPIVGDARSAGRAYDAWKQGDYGGAALEGLGTAVGWVPVAGPLARGGVRLARNADMVRPALTDPDYAKLLAREVAGKKGPMAKSAGASARLGTDAPVYKFTEHAKANQYTDRLGLPDTPEARKAASDIAQDATAIRAGKRVDDPSISEGTTEWYEGVNPRETGIPNYVNPDIPLVNEPQDLVDYALPTRAKWKELYPNTPYPTKKPGILTAPPRKMSNKIPGKQNPMWKPDSMDPFGFAEAHYTTGPRRGKHRVGPKVGDIAPGVGPIGAPKAAAPANPFAASLKAKGYTDAQIAAIMKAQGG